MGRKVIAGLVAGVLAFLPAGSFGLPLGEAGQCIPTGLPAFETWTLRAAKPLDISDEVGKEWPGLYALFMARGQLIATIWVGNLLVSVDDNPNDKAAPGWHDRGAVREDTTLLAERRQRCDWFQPTPPPKESS